MRRAEDERKMKKKRAADATRRGRKENERESKLFERKIDVVFHVCSEWG